jgi:Golgi phosphoprotein 3
MSQRSGLVRRTAAKSAIENGAASSKDVDRDGKESKDSDSEDVDSKETRLTLMEEVLLLGLKDKEVC